MFDSARDRRSQREHSFRPQLEVLEARTMLSGTPAPAPVPVPAPTPAPTAASTPAPSASGSNPLLDLAKLGFDAMKYVADGTILTAELAVIFGGGEAVAGSVAAAEAIKHALEIPSAVGDVATYQKDLASGDFVKAGQDLVGMLGVNPQTVINDWNDVMEDWSKGVEDFRTPGSSLPTPTPQPAPAPQGQGGGSQITYNENAPGGPGGGQGAPMFVNLGALTLK